MEIEIKHDSPPLFFLNIFFIYIVLHEKILKRTNGVQLMFRCLFLTNISLKSDFFNLIALHYHDNLIEKISNCPFYILRLNLNA